jgi:hypothetical protein
VGIEPTHKGFADLSLTTWVPRHRSFVRFRGKPLHLYFVTTATTNPSQRRGLTGLQLHLWAEFETKSGAGDGGRTRDFDLGKVALYH